RRPSPGPRGTSPATILHPRATPVQAEGACGRLQEPHEMRPRLVCAVKVAAAAGLGMALWLVPVSATARPAKGSAGLAFHANVQASNQKPAGWNEPSAIAGSDGELYIAAQNGTTTGRHNISLFQSSNGRAWHE